MAHIVGDRSNLQFQHRENTDTHTGLKRHDDDYHYQDYSRVFNSHCCPGFRRAGDRGELIHSEHVAGIVGLLEGRYGLCFL